jgi:hypothetical protein
VSVFGAPAPSLFAGPFRRSQRGRWLIAPGFVDAGWTWTRAQAGGARSTAFRGGLWREFGPDVPRFTAFGVLVGGQRTNLNPNILTPFGTGWTNTSISNVTPIIGPDGVIGSAARITEGPETSSHRGFPTGENITQGLPYAIAGLFRAGTRSFVQITASAARFGTDFFANFDLATGVVGAVGSTVTNTRMFAVGGGWYWCEIAGVAIGSTGTGSLLAGMVTAANSVRLEPYAGTSRTLDAFWMWMEQGAFASNPILPAVDTPAASTRGADLPTAALASLGIGANGACTVLLTAIIPTASPAIQTILTLDDGTANNRFRLFTVSGGSSLNVGRTLAGVGSSNTIATAPANTPFAAGVVINGAGRIAGVLGGGSVIQQLGGPTNDLTTMRLGANASGTENLFGEIGHLQILPYAVSDTELQARVAALPLT